ncbi:MAG: nickel pincer cofactor biosynthesis protein LarC [Syntrophorhabdaceae bacterium]|nr:nickel pincer cofactor biosynthesis protein LarC [Syntrophorhabdaceae bacterium]
MRIVYIDPIFGISGDMTISAFLDAGLPFDGLMELLKKFPLQIPDVIPERLESGVVKGIHLKIGHSHTHLTINEMFKLIEEVQCRDSIKEHVRQMLESIIGAEGKVHNLSKDELHLHELSNIDTLIDLFGVAYGMDYFEVERVYAGPIPHGRGTIKTSHGMIPNPPPVTLEMLSGFNTYFLDVPLELTTPTGAAIVSHYVKDKNTMPPPFKIEKIGYGVGTYKTERPDVLRLFFGRIDRVSSDEEVYILEADMDDMETEYLGAVADRIRGQGALDVLYFPVYMKKGRPGIRLSVIVKEEKMEEIKNLMLHETTTFGIRIRREHRTALQREVRTISTSLGDIRVKVGFDNEGKPIKTHIEYEDVKSISEKKGLPYRNVLEALYLEIGKRDINLGT